MSLRRRLMPCLAVFLYMVNAPNLCGAGEFPLWEAGFGATGLTIADYRGSNQQRFYALPMPYLIYRGEVLKLDRKGLYSQLFHSKRVELNFSADAGVPVKSDHNTARVGMSDLDPTFQIGPSLEICLSQDCKADRAIQLQVPVRAVFAIAEDFSHFKGIGFVANPRINFDFRNIGPGGGWFLGFAVGPLFATDDYHNYYYTVDPPYAIPNLRPAYDAHGGYSGTVLQLGVTKRFKQIWFGAFARYDYLGGAEFQHSPLMRTDHFFSAGFGIAWVFAQSKTIVQASE